METSPIVRGSSLIRCLSLVHDALVPPAVTTEQGSNRGHISIDNSTCSKFAAPLRVSIVQCREAAVLREPGADPSGQCDAIAASTARSNCSGADPAYFGVGVIVIVLKDD